MKRNVVNKIVKNQRGFSLVELMVALLLSLFVMAGIIGLFSITKSTSQTDTGLARLQENTRFLNHLLAKEIRMAGYLGCLTDSTQIASMIDDADKNNLPFTFAAGINGFEFTGTGVGGAYTVAYSTAFPAVGSWDPALDASIAGRAVAGSDIIVIRRVDDNGYRLIPAGGSGEYHDAANVFVENAADGQINNGDILILSDCAKATVFQASNVTTIGFSPGGGINVEHAVAGTPGNQCAAWGTGGCTDPQDPTYQGNAEIFVAKTTVFFIGNATTQPDPTRPIPALFMANIQGNTISTPAIELIRGVENMQILYGVDQAPTIVGTARTLDRADTYMTATAVTAGNHWPNVVSVRISLLMRTMNEPGEQADQTADAKTYALVGTTITPPNDQNRRRIFTSTIQIRNRVR